MPNDNLPKPSKEDEDWKNARGFVVPEYVAKAVAQLKADNGDREQLVYAIWNYLAYGETDDCLEYPIYVIFDQLKPELERCIEQR